MYLNKPGSTKIVEKGYTMYIPPVPHKELILNHDLPRHKQFWRRKGLPSYYNERRAEEEYIQDQQKNMGNIVTHYDPILEKFRRDQWMKRIYGIFVYIDGVPTYLTGPHWMFLEWAKGDHDNNDGYALYDDDQRLRFYFRDLCRWDPFCLGYIIIGPRGFGKTYEEASMILEDMTRPPHNRRATLQSKSEDDAKDAIFQDKLVLMFNNYPHYFKPEYNHGTQPSRGFSFKRSSRKGKFQKTQTFTEHDELGNTIIIKPAKEKAVDGKSTANCYTDEVGKTPKKEADVYKRNQVLLKCVYRNNRKVGLIRATTTVEEMEEGGAECEKLWNESDPNKRDSNGYTKFSKLYQWFVSGREVKSQFMNEFGKIDKVKAKEFMDNERKDAQHDTETLSSIMRKDPASPEEAFIQPASKSLFQPFIIANRIQELKDLPNLPGRVGNLHWSNGKNSPVWLDSDPDGLFRIFILPDNKEGFDDVRKSRKILNATKKGYDDFGKTIFLPANNDLFGGGADPVKNIKTEDARASKLAGYGFKKFDPLVDHPNDTKNWLSYNFAWKYNYRSDDPETDFDNIHKALWYFSHAIMPEGNITELVRYLQRHGMGKFLYLRKNFEEDMFRSARSKTSMEEAVATQAEVWQTIITLLQQHVVRHGHRIPDLELLQQLKEFDPKKPTKFDLVVAAGYTLMSLKAIDFDEYFTPEDRELVDNILPMYDQSGNVSKLIVPHDEQYTEVRLPVDYEQDILGIFSRR